MTKKKTRYGVRRGYRLKGDAQDIGEELDALRKKSGGLKREQVWRAAKKKKSAMHGEFTWDVKRAAERCWSEEAGYLMRAISLVTYEAETRTGADPRALVSVMDDDHGGSVGSRTFYPRDVVKKSDALRRKALREAILYLKAGREKYLELADELGHIWEAIDELDVDDALESVG